MGISPWGILWAGTGGFIGACLRWLAFWACGLWPGTRVFWTATLLVNILGSFLIGFFSPLWLDPQHPARLFAVVGVLGGFTTFSTFSYDMLRLLQSGRWALAAVYAAVSVLGGVLAAGLGAYIGGGLK